MIQQDIAILVETNLQTKGYLTRRNLDPEELNLYVDKAASEFVDEILDNFRRQGTVGYDDKELVLNQLRAFKKSSGDLPLTSTSATEVSFAVPEDYRDYIKILVKIGDLHFPCRVLDSEVFDDLKSDTYHGTDSRSPICTIEGNSIKVAVSGFTVTHGALRYICKLPAFDSTSGIEWQVGTGNSAIVIPRSFVDRVVDKTTVLLGSAIEVSQQKLSNISTLSKLN